jgi:hypothetical protein
VSQVAEKAKRDIGTIDVLVHSLANGPEVTVRAPRPRARPRTIARTHARAHRPLACVLTPPCGCPPPPPHRPPAEAPAGDVPPRLPGCHVCLLLLLRLNAAGGQQGRTCPPRERPECVCVCVWPAGLAASPSRQLRPLAGAAAPARGLQGAALRAACRPGEAKGARGLRSRAAPQTWLPRPPACVLAALWPPDERRRLRHLPDLHCC